MFDSMESRVLFHSPCQTNWLLSYNQKTKNHEQQKLARSKFLILAFSVHIYIKHSNTLSKVGLHNLHVLLKWYSFYNLMHAYKGTGKKASNSNNIWSNHIKTRAVHGVKNNADLDFVVTWWPVTHLLPSKLSHTFVVLTPLPSLPSITQNRYLR